MNDVDIFLEACGREGKLEEVLALLDDGQSPNVCNHLGYTPLMSAARSYQVEIVRLLLERGADSSASAKDGWTSLHSAVGEAASVPEDQEKCVVLLIEAKANIDAITDTGITPLMNAAWFGCIGAVRLLVEQGANVKAKDNQNRTAYDMAIARKHSEIAKALGGA